MQGCNPFYTWAVFHLYIQVPSIWTYVNLDIFFSLFPISISTLGLFFLLPIRFLVKSHGRLRSSHQVSRCRCIIQLAPAATDPAAPGKKLKCTNVYSWVC
ncbi:unnamed protein product [Pipistrellus nathusii]|uniref:Uncharacterized protein n=1 Tax=Pipistrellus nathusii TaxID=59473 RepID=A0ABN9ZDT6_PIPNA